MKFLCDVHISYKITSHLKSLGFEAIHVNDILDKSETKDADICRYADQNDYIVLTKDSDFRNSYFVKRTPKKLIKINLGNIPNLELKNIISKYLSEIQKLNSRQIFFIEIDCDCINLIELD